MPRTQTDIGELIRIFFDQFMDVYGDADIASVATAAVINDLLTAETEDEQMPAVVAA